MIKLLKIDFKKIRGSRVFWILTGLYALLIILFFFGVQGFLDDLADEANKKSPIPLPGLSAYSLPDIWHNLAYIAGYFKMFLGVVVIILITSEYSYKTIRQNVISGMSRWDFLKSKLPVFDLPDHTLNLSIIEMTGLDNEKVRDIRATVVLQQATDL